MVVYYVPLGTAAKPFNFQFSVNDNAYKGIEDELGVKEIEDNTPNLYRGGSPKATRIVFTCRRDTAGGGGAQVSAKRFCAPGKVAGILAGGMNGKKIKIDGVDHTITGASTPG